MKQLFISYSRKDTEITRRLTERFETDGLEAWVDWQDIPPSLDWMKEIQKGIEDADIFLYLVSPDSISSSVCAEEVNHAVANGKRIIPVVVRDFDAKLAPSSITHLNWIFFSRPQDDFERAFEQVWSAIHTDFDWVQVHRRLQVRALEWDRNHHEESFLLRGKDLREAEAQLTVNALKDPRPTELQHSFVRNSRESEDLRLEEQRTKEQQLELERTTGTRLRRLTFAMLVIFSVAFALLYLWLYKLVTDLSLASIKNQMIALVESGSVSIDGQQFHQLVGEYPSDSTAAYNDPYFASLEGFLTKVKHVNSSVDPHMSYYAIASGLKQGEIMVVVSADREYTFKQPFVLDDLQYSQIAGLQKTTADLETGKNEFSNKISACTPIRDQQARSVGALCTDFHLDIVTETRSSVARTLAIAFLAIYPAMILLVLYATRSLSKFSIKIPGKKPSSEQ
ncbi:MAG TPA: toll/interleukin-1 receptor domain-containing protein [Anaerolineales bacterium]|nr:toll/interleukin-1 receptor domain-containing protein [Anaerolineales bacterium]